MNKLIRDFLREKDYEEPIEAQNLQAIRKVIRANRQEFKTRLTEAGYVFQNCISEQCAGIYVPLIHSASAAIQCLCADHRCGFIVDESERLASEHNVDAVFTAVPRGVRWSLLCALTLGMQDDTHQSLQRDINLVKDLGDFLGEYCLSRPYSAEFHLRIVLQPMDGPVFVVRAYCSKLQNKATTSIAEQKAFVEPPGSMKLDCFYKALLAKVPITALRVGKNIADAPQKKSNEPKEQHATENEIANEYKYDDDDDDCDKDSLKECEREEDDFISFPRAIFRRSQFEYLIVSQSGLISLKLCDKMVEPVPICEHELCKACEKQYLARLRQNLRRRTSFKQQQANNKWCVEQAELCSQQHSGSSSNMDEDNDEARQQ